jgi:hypothetical protein
MVIETLAAIGILGVVTVVAFAASVAVGVAMVRLGLDEPVDGSVAQPVHQPTTWEPEADRLLAREPAATSLSGARRP